MRTFDLAATDAIFPNPERGFYVGYDLRRGGDASVIRMGGDTLAIAVVKLARHRRRPLDARLLATLHRGFQQVRTAGIKVILRFSYNAAFAADAPRATILGHLDQLAPLLYANADVIAIMQAGFIGAWGEWHGSTNRLANPTDRAAILDALLAALPASRGVQVRTPMYKAAYVPGGPVSDAEAFTGSARARLGHHNDAFLASDDDLGTYAVPVSAWQAYLAEDSRYTAVGGETCAVNPPRTNRASALAEMERLHWSYLNRHYHPAVVAGFVAQGCADEIERRLGYRFTVGRVAHSEAVAPGGELRLELDVRNVGFAAPYNPRPVELVLVDGETRHTVRISHADARRWAPGTHATLTVRLRIPSPLASGSYVLALRLPDEATSLADDPRYAIRLANQGIWDGATGDNVLTRALVIDPSAAGPRAAAAAAFMELPRFGAFVNI